MLTGLIKILNAEEIRMCGMFRWTFRNCIKLIDGGDKQEQEKGYSGLSHDSQKLSVLTGLFLDFNLTHKAA